MGGPEKSSLLISENTDGTLTFWMWDAQLGALTSANYVWYQIVFTLNTNSPIENVTLNNGAARFCWNAEYIWWAPYSNVFPIPVAGGGSFAGYDLPGLSRNGSPCNPNGKFSTFNDPEFHPYNDYVQMPSLSPRDFGQIRPVYRARIHISNLVPNKTTINIGNIQHLDTITGTGTPGWQSGYVFDTGYGSVLTLHGAGQPSAACQ